MFVRDFVAVQYTINNRRSRSKNLRKIMAEHIGLLQITVILHHSSSPEDFPIQDNVFNNDF
ncbi:hypothetical protein V7122_21215 [Bacillus sp. JJ1532]|uniref:hypothetical protein n=1 Tax=Bacillus sp. JJ1532 TaxID=3122958 RepID=UPI0030006B86